MFRIETDIHMTIIKRSPDRKKNEEEKEEEEKRSCEREEEEETSQIGQVMYIKRTISKSLSFKIEYCFNIKIKC